MSDFADQLAAVVTSEALTAKGDPDRMSGMVERLAAALGFTVALAAKGEPSRIDDLMEGAGAYAHAEAVQKAPVARMAAALRKDGR